MGTGALLFAIEQTLTAVAMLRSSKVCYATELTTGDAVPRGHSLSNSDRFIAEH